jgi:hypothetical protein
MQLNIGGGSVYDALTVGATATEVKVGSSALGKRHTVVINNVSGNSIYYGWDSNVTTSNGLELQAGETVVLSLDIEYSQKIYAIASANTEVRIAELRSSPAFKHKV